MRFSRTYYFLPSTLYDKLDELYKLDKLDKLDKLYKLGDHERNIAIFGCVDAP